MKVVGNAPQETSRRLTLAAYRYLADKGQLAEAREVLAAGGMRAPAALALSLARALMADARFFEANGWFGLTEWKLPFPPEGEAVVVIDLETTGPSPTEDEITEVGAVKLNGDGKSEFVSLVYPGRPIPPYIQDLTGITDEMVAQAPPLAEVMADLAEFVGDSVLAIQNAPFDLSFLVPRLAKVGCSLYQPVLDTVHLARRALRLPHCGLDALAEYFELPKNGRHRALGDARLTAEVLRQLYYIMCKGRQLRLAELR
ncbi:MAG: 3'-5' exonuclease [Deinococcus sp.]|nr:3'-5' exonuclease [Deinococcus sp.]